MALTKTRVVDRIEILRNGVVQVRESVEVEEGGELLGQKFIRSVYTPNMPLSEIPIPKVRALCNFVWTDAVKAAYQAELAAQQR